MVPVTSVLPACRTKAARPTAYHTLQLRWFEASRRLNGTYLRHRGCLGAVVPLIDSSIINVLILCYW
ncbi:unnamed protein product [Acanthocheilonema viteae]|uniref:Uncharacterized protein n=1 Tax=Acanthocheilonema viteae TaxID=6277 RepID=A0A498SBV5_ACAVI|nr:unnamed protein product [Acanthocheilonema viteae]